MIDWHHASKRFCLALFSSGFAPNSIDAVQFRPGKGFLNKWTTEDVRKFFDLRPDLSDQEVHEIKEALNTNDLILKWRAYND